MFRALIVVLAVVACVSADPWESFKKDFNRKYRNGAEEALRHKCFMENLKKIAALNAVGHELHAVNKFADLCAEEFKTYHNLKMKLNKKYNYAPEFSPEELVKVGDSVDWRSKGAVTGVKDQGQCGSCWAFSATGNMEGQWFMSQKTLISLSEQELVSCSGSSGNEGCNGGLMDDAFDWVSKNGITSEANYPYTSGGGSTGTCKKAKESPIVANFTGHQDIANNEDQMATWVSKNGPLAIAVDASSGWQTYSGGVMKTCRGKQLDHGVLAVGYGTDATGTNYWIVKNSWGPSWGEKGYIRLQKGTDQCGLTQDPSTAVVAK